MGSQESPLCIYYINIHNVLYKQLLERQTSLLFTLDKKYYFDFFIIDKAIYLSIYLSIWFIYNLEKYISIILYIIILVDTNFISH